MSFPCTDPTSLLDDTWSGLSAAHPILDRDIVGRYIAPGLYSTDNHFLDTNAVSSSSVSVSTAAEEAFESSWDAFLSVASVPKSR